MYRSSAEGDPMNAKYREERKHREYARDKRHQELEDSGGPVLFRHPHYPFVWMTALIDASGPALIQLWRSRPHARTVLVERWCDRAKNSRFAWDECDKLREYLIQQKEELPTPLLQLKRTLRKGHPGANRALAEDLLVLNIYECLVDDCFDSKEAEIAIGLLLDVHPSTIKEKLCRAREEFLGLD